MTDSIPPGGMSGAGLVKITEEASELSEVLARLVAVCAKKLAFPNKDEHPDKKGPLRQRIEDEIADVRAALLFVENKWGLDRARMADRTLQKLRRFQTWDEKEIDHG